MRSPIQVRTGCPWCGPIVVDGARFGCEIDPGQPERGLCQLTCPECSRPIFVPTTAAFIRGFFKAGGQQLEGPVPFELLESHSGAVITWDDLLDFKLALDRSL